MRSSARGRDPKWRHHTDTRPLEWAGPRRITGAGWKWRYQQRGRHWPNTHRRPFLTPLQVRLLQALADGADRHEIACAEGFTWDAVERQVYILRLKLGAHSVTEAVAQGLKRGIIRPDKATLRQATRDTPGVLQRHHVHRTVRLMRRVAMGDARQPAPGHTDTAETIKWLHARSVPHVMSILWAAHRVTSVWVAQTGPQFRQGRGASKRWTDGAGPAPRHAGG